MYKLARLSNSDVVHAINGSTFYCRASHLTRGLGVPVFTYDLRTNSHLRLCKHCFEDGRAPGLRDWMKEMNRLLREMQGGGNDG